MKTLYTFLILFSIGLSMTAQGIPIRQETNLDDVYSQYGLDGEGVLIIVIDRGIDYRHPDFLDTNGDTRLAYVYDMIDQTGANDPDNPYGIGSIFDAADIDAALDNNDPPLSTDRYGHGTATAGIAAGNGTGTAGGEFQGVAPEATIISIKITHDPFPAFGGEPAQSGFFDPTYIPVALQFAQDKIAELGLPAVTLMNIGSVGGPSDGTSTICRAIDDFVDAGHTFVLGVGDDGGNDNHASTNISQGETIEIEIDKAEAGNLRFDLWYSEDDRFTVSIERPNSVVEGPFAAPTGPGDAVDQFLAGISMFHRGADVEFFGATSNRRELLIDFSGATGVYKVILEGASITSGDFHATLNPSTHFNNNRFLTYVVPGYSIADYATSFGGITPTDYVADPTWTDIDGIPRMTNNQGSPGEIWPGASSSPTQDDRLGVDFAIPGEVSHAAYADDTYYEFFSFNVLQNSNGLYGIQNAVSGAAPVALGVIALMLEVNPNLTPSEIRTLLQNASYEDGFTGSVPNDTWGYGKLDALQLIDDTFDTLGTEDLVLSEVVLYPNPASDMLNIASKTPVVKVQFVDLLGRQVFDIENSEGITEIQVSALPNGMYFARLVDGNGSSTTIKFIKN